MGNQIIYINNQGNAHVYIFLQLCGLLITVTNPENLDKTGRIPTVHKIFRVEKRIITNKRHVLHSSHVCKIAASLTLTPEKKVRISCILIFMTHKVFMTENKLLV